MMANEFSGRPASDLRPALAPALALVALMTVGTLNFCSPCAAEPAKAKSAKAAAKPSAGAKTADAQAKSAPAKPSAVAKTGDPVKQAAPAKPAAPAAKTAAPAAKAAAPAAKNDKADEAQAPLTEDAKRVIKARSLAKEGRYDDACAELRSVIKSNPNNVEALYFLGYVLGRQGRYEPSIVAEKHALEIDPNNAPAYAVLGLSLGSLHQYSEAARALQSAIRLQPLAPSCYVNLAAIYEKQGDYKKAEGLYKRAIQIDSSYAKAYLGLGEVLGKIGDKTGRIDACRNAVKYAPKSAIAHAKLGMALSDVGDFSGSIAEGFTANALKVQESWNDFLGTFLAAWGLVFLGFSLIFAVVFAGSRFKPQEGEKVMRSFFLTFYKDQPGRFVVTDSRLVFVPEIFSSIMGATRVSIQRSQVESIQYLSTMGGGTVSILTKDKSVHQFRMPILVLDPLRSLLVSQALAGLGGDDEPAAEASGEGDKKEESSQDAGEAAEKSEATPEVKAEDARESAEPAKPPVIPAELEITEVDTEMVIPESKKHEDNG